MPDQKQSAQYGFDAPGVMAGLLGGGLAGIAMGIIIGVLAAQRWLISAGVVIAVLSLVPAFLGTCMLMYSLAGKHRTRDLLLNFASWNGDEQVLDIGTGRGLMAIGAAKRLSIGSVVGMDLWSTADLSDNSAENARRNAVLEGVADKVEIQTGDARQLNFRDRTFDRVLTLLCLHNIEAKSEQKNACREIARVLKPGGILLLGDYVPVGEYAKPA